MRHSLFPAALLLPATAALAITIRYESAAVNHRFASGFRTDAPVQNTNPSFLAAGYDLSSIGWWELPGSNTRVKHTTLIAPMFSVDAAHYKFSAGNVIHFLATDGTLKANTIATATTAFGDMSVNRYQSAFTEADSVSVIRVLDISSLNYLGQPALIAGSTNTNPTIGTKFATAKVATIDPTQGSVGFYNHNQDNTLSFIQLQSGDSGSPTLIPYKNEITLIGTVTGASAGGSSAYSPTQINAVIAPFGYALKFTIYDQPSDAANTANVWTGGAASGSFSTAANWSKGVAPGNAPVVFDASANNGQSTVTLAADQSLRGLLFRANAGSQGFTFDGPGTLTTAWTGIRNEDTKTQTFNIPLALAASQNWEAAAGDLVFNGDIDTAGHLLVVGGARDTTIAGVLSGAGSLAKDDSGVLSLRAAASYAGKTWIHNGTLRLDAPGAALPSSTTVVFDTANPGARLDLNGHDQTLAGLRSEFGGTGRVAFGSGATLTLDIAANTLATADNFTGGISGSGNLVKTGAGLSILSGQNTLDGALDIRNGVLRVADPGNARILLTGPGGSQGNGFLEVPSGDFAATLGDGPGQISVAGEGGFSAYGGDLRVTLDGGAQLQVGSTHLKAVVLGSAHSNGTTELTNDLHLLAGATRRLTAADGSAAVDARISGDISGPASFDKYGAGVLELTGHNTQTGVTTIRGGALRLGNAQSHSATSNIALSGGVLELGYADYSATLGSTAGQVRWGGGTGGFSAAYADRSVTLNNGATLVWGSTQHFIADGQNFILSSTGSDSTLTFTNHIDLNQTGSGSRTFRVENGTAAVDARLSGNLTGGFNLVKDSRAGTLELTGSNSWTGATRILGGALRVSSAGALPALANVEISGGVLELGHADYSATLGAGAGQVRFTGNGGFSAAYADRTVTLENGSALSWAAGSNFLTDTRTLILSSAGSDSTITLANAINFGSSGGTRTLRVDNGSAAVDARLSGNLAGNPGTLVKTGAGTLEFAGVNTYAGPLRIDEGAVRFATAAARPSNSQIIFRNGVLELTTGDYTGTLNESETGNTVFARTTGAAGGFSAIGAGRSVTFNNGAALRWAGSYEMPSGFTLLLSSENSDATVDFRNPLQLSESGPMERYVRVADGSAAIDARLSGVISGTRYGITKTGLGTLEFTAANTYGGDTHVMEGRLLVNGDQAAATGRVLVESGATLGGSGTVGGATRVLTGATLAPGSGSAPATLAFSDSLVFEAGSTLRVLIDSATNHAAVTVAGAADLGGATLDLALGAAFGDTAQPGLVVTLLSTPSLLGLFSQGSSMSVIDEDLRYAFDILYLSSGVSLTLTSVGAVPEPATSASLAALAAASLPLLRRRRGHRRIQGRLTQ